MQVLNIKCNILIVHDFINEKLKNKNTNKVILLKGQLTEKSKLTEIGER